MAISLQAKALGNTTARLPARRASLAAPRSRHVCAFRTERKSEVPQQEAIKQVQENQGWSSAKDRSIRTPENQARITNVELQEDVETGQEQLREYVDRIKAKWNSLEDKKTVTILAVGTLAATWLGGKILDGAHAIPILPISDTLTFVGLLYSASFLWKYVVFSEGRRELRSSLSEVYQNIRDSLEGDEPKTWETSSSSTSSSSQASRNSAPESSEPKPHTHIAKPWKLDPLPGEETDASQ